jgi:xylose isomerase
MEKTRSTKIIRMFEGQKLKKKLQRRYRLFESDLMLVITNNQTQYIDVEVSCLDKNIHRRNACELLKEIIYICSPSK